MKNEAVGGTVLPVYVLLVAFGFGTAPPLAKRLSKRQTSAASPMITVQMDDGGQLVKWLRPWGYC